jgi:hypothetical protein
MARACEALKQADERLYAQAMVKPDIRKSSSSAPLDLQPEGGKTSLAEKLALECGLSGFPQATLMRLPCAFDRLVDFRVGSENVRKSCLVVRVISTRGIQRRAYAVAASNAKDRDSTAGDSRLDIIRKTLYPVGGVDTASSPTGTYHPTA